MSEDNNSAYHQANDYLNSIDSQHVEEHDIVTEVLERAFFMLLRVWRLTGDARIGGYLRMLEDDLNPNNDDNFTLD